MNTNRYGRIVELEDRLEELAEYIRLWDADGYPEEDEGLSLAAWELLEREVELIHLELDGLGA